jgi:hypothetical protein
MSTTPHKAYREVLKVLPAGYTEISAELSVSRSTARDHVADLRADDDVRIVEEKQNGEKIFYDASRPSHTESENREVVKSKQAKSKEATQYLHGMQERLERLLDSTEPATLPDDRPLHATNEDVVIHRTDAHFGDEITDEFGNKTYSVEIAKRREQAVVTRTIEEVEHRRELGVEYDMAHYLLGGDQVTGENIYPNQQSELQQTLDEQLETAFEVYMSQIQRLSAEFPAVQVVCQPGNHGVLEASYSDGANADKILYMMLDQAVRFSDMKNVRFIRNSSTRFTNFFVRGTRESYEDQNQGWKFHLRHGDDSLEHIGTSSGKKRWYKWLLRHEFDQAYRGHYHKFEIDTLHEDITVYMTGSPKPPDDFEESIAEWSQPTATVHGVSDDQQTTWIEPIAFS